MSCSFNPPVWCMTTNSITDYIIIVIDGQKPWERVVDYLVRVIALFHSRRMSVQRDGLFMYRVFLGGLREDIQERIMCMGPRVPLLRAVRRAIHYERILSVKLPENIIEDYEDDDAFMYAAFEKEERGATDTLDEDDELARGTLFGKSVVALNGSVGKVEQGVVKLDGAGVGACELAEGGASMNDGDGVGESAGESDVDGVGGGMGNGMSEGNDGGVDDDEAGREDQAVGGAPADGPSGDFGVERPEVPYIIQNGQEFFGKPNEAVNRLFQARFILILYR